VIHHYCNLICWEHISNLTSQKGHFKLYCDSLSFQIMAQIFGFKLELTAGSNSHTSIISNVRKKHVLFLLPRVPNTLFESYIVLPKFGEEPYIQKEVLDIVKKENIKTVFIGISSPKQNQYAEKLSVYFPYLEIYCVGAILDQIAENGDLSQIHKISSGKGFEWAVFLIKAPKRTVVKMAQVLLNSMAIILDRRRRLKFRNFCQRF
jgi:hypothetical protein